MKAIELNKYQRDKLIKMCIYFFPELESKAQDGYKRWNKSSGDNALGDGFWINGAGIIMCSYPIDWDLHEHLIKDKNNIGIYWFEFCMKDLYKEFKRLGVMEDFVFQKVQLGINPIDFYWRYFKLLKL